MNGRPIDESDVGAVGSTETTQTAGNKDQFEHLAEVSKNARTTLFLLLLGCAYCVLAIVATGDAELLGNTSALPLPVIDVEVRVQGFYMAGPIVLLAVYFYLHLYLQEMWRGIARLLARSSNADSVADSLYPWIISVGMLRAYGSDSRSDKFALHGVEKWFSIIVAWWIVPFVIAMFWARYLMVHDWIVTSVQSLLLGVSIAGAYFLHQVAIRILQGKIDGDWAFGDFSVRRGKVLMSSFLLSWLVIFGVSYSAMYSASDKSCEGLAQPSGCGLLYFSGRLMADLGRPPFATLEGQDIGGAALQGRNISNGRAARAELGAASLRETNLSWIDLSGANLQGADLTRAKVQHGNLTGTNLDGALLIGTMLERTDLYTAELMGAKVDNAIFRGSNLVRANLQRVSGRQTDLTGADLRFALLNDAELPAAKFDRAQMDAATLNNANFERASFVGASLSRGSLERTILSAADFSGASMDQANLIGAEMFGSVLADVSLNRATLDGVDAPNIDLENAQLIAAKLKKADLRGASLQNSDLSDADLSGALLQRARLDGAKLVAAILTDANLAGSFFGDADLTGAILDGANVSGASMANVKGLLQHQLEVACGDIHTELPKELTAKNCFESESL